MNYDLRLAIAASITAIAITSTLDAIGYGMFSAMILIPLIPLFAVMGKFSRADLGFKLCPKGACFTAIAAPLVLLGLLTAAVILLGVTSPTREEWGLAIIVIIYNSVAGVLLVAVTEEGFFRGILWASLQRAGQNERQVLWTSTFVFVVWHLSAVLLAEDYAPALFQVPIYLVNATLLGLIWGLMRRQSGSIWPPAIYHSIWNAVVYQLYGFGKDSGDLGVEPTWIYGPEIGFVGILLSGAVLLYLIKNPLGSKRSLENDVATN